MTDGGEEIIRMPCIYYPVQFQEGQEQVMVLLDSGSEANAMSPGYAKKLGLKT